MFLLIILFYTDSYNRVYNSIYLYMYFKTNNCNAPKNNSFDGALYKNYIINISLWEC